MTNIRGITPPEGGWQPFRYYAVEVTFSENNVPHRSIFYSGFVRGGEPGGFACIFNPVYEPPTCALDTVFSLRVIRELDITSD